MKRDPNDRLSTGEGGTTLYPGWPRGINTRAADIDIPVSQLRDAVNVDLRDSGTPLRRPGYGITAITDPIQAVYGADDYLVYKSGATVYSVNKSLSAVDSEAGFSEDTSLACVRINDDLYVSDGYKSSRMVGATGAVEPWSIETPFGAPILATATGVLPAGVYMVGISFISSTGEESGLSNVSTITLSTAGGIALSGIQQPTDSRVSYIRVYASQADGAELYFNGLDLAVGVTTATIAVAEYYQPCEVRGLSRVPAGDVLTLAAGRLCSAYGRMVYYSAPLRFGLHQLYSDFLYFPAPVTVMYGTASGLYVCADQTYFIEGLGQPDMAQRVLLPYGAVKGTLAVLPDVSGALWMSANGIVKAAFSTPEITNVSEQMGVSIERARSGAVAVRQDDGMQTAIFVNNSPVDGTSVSAGDFFNAEIIRSTQ